MRSPLAALLFFTILGCGGSAPKQVATEPAAKPAAVASADTTAIIAKVIAAPDRSDEDRALDAGRKAPETLGFFGIAPGMHVGELFAGGGYTTEVLGRTVGPSGKVYAQNSKELLDKFARAPWTARAAKPVNANVVGLEHPFDAPFAPEVAPGSLDAVVMILNYHDTVNIGTDRMAMNKAIFAALKPGGVYGIVDHAAPDGSGVRDTNTTHRIDEAVVKQEITAAGFVLDGESAVLRNPSDPRDWNASPHAAADKRGTSDRFTLRFKKP